MNMRDVLRCHAMLNQIIFYSKSKFSICFNDDTIYFWFIIFTKPSQKKKIRLKNEKRVSATICTFSQIISADYGRPERKQPSLHSQKITPTPKFLGTAEAYFVCHIGPIFQISLIYPFIGCPQSVIISNEMQTLAIRAVFM